MTPENQRRSKNGKWTLAQLRATDAIIPLQSGTNQFDSQRGMTGFGMPRDVKGKHLKRIWELEFPEEAIQDSPYPPEQPYNPEAVYQDSGNNYQHAQSPNSNYYQQQQQPLRR
uniref:Calponin n=1 Tax=Acrobeloides nanus TaxID=290746 RepID=A0A914E123_9BILA